MNVISGNVVVNNKKKVEIVAQIDSIPEILKKDKSYDYLLKMPIYSLTKEKIDILDKQLLDKKESYNYLNRSTPKKLWSTDLKE